MDPQQTFELEEQARRAAKSAKLLQEELVELSTGDIKEPQNPELAALMKENQRLAYQLEHLKQAFDKEVSSKNTSSFNISAPKNSINLINVISEIISTAQKTAFPDEEPLPQISLGNSKMKNAGMYQSNGAMSLAGRMKAKGVKMPPPAVAKAIVDAIPENNVISEAVISGPGFININIKKEFLEQEVTKMLHEGVLPPSVQKKKVIIDFSSPNIAKEMHVGHLRSTIIGESLARLLEYVGHNVKRINHVGDWGTQFGMLIANLKDEYPNYQTESIPISDLQTFYRAAKARFDSDPDFKRRAYDEVVKLQAKDEDVIKAWQLICDVSRKEFQQIYDRLGVSLTEQGESYYQERMESMAKELLANGTIIDDETAPGRKIAWSSAKEKTHLPLVLIKSDGGFTYDTSDLACLRYRAHEENADWLVYVVDKGQEQHFVNVFSLAKDLGWTEGKRVDHVGFGVVLGSDHKKFKTRSGDTVLLKDLLDEGVSRAKTTLAERNNNVELTQQESDGVAEAVAYGCIKYADLSKVRTNDYVFSFDQMLQDKGNTAVYLLYANTRIRSILRQEQTAHLDLEELSRTSDISLSHPKEIKLAQQLARYPEIVENALETLCPHLLCDYIFELSTVFTEMYAACYVVQKKDGHVFVDVNRLLLVKAVGSVMDQVFHLLGIQPIDKM